MKKNLNRILIFLCCGLFSFSPLSAQQTTQIEPSPVVILGGGVGALTSSIYLQRAGIHAIVIEGQSPGGSIAQSPMVHNWPGEMQIEGLVLVEKIKEQALANGAEILSQEVVSVDFSKRPFTITTRDLFDQTKTQTITAASCIIALGSTPRLLGIPGESGEKGYWTKGVYSCAVCDGALYKDKTVAVIGGGDSALIEADYLSQIAKKVYIVLRSKDFRTVETLRKNQLLQKPNVEVLYETKVLEVQGDGQKVSHLVLSTPKGKETLSVEGIFIAIGATPNSELFQSQLALDKNGYIILENDQETSVKGVYAIGDIVDPIYKQAISAAGDGAKAALQVDHFLAKLRAQEHAPSQASITDKKEEVALPIRNPLLITNSTFIELSSSSQLQEEIDSSSLPILVYFYSPTCVPCRQMAPEFEKVATLYKGRLKCIKANAILFPELAESYKVSAVPTVMLFIPKGKAIEKQTGVANVTKFFQTLDVYTKY